VVIDCPDCSTTLSIEELESIGSFFVSTYGSPKVAVELRRCPKCWNLVCLSDTMVDWMGPPGAAHLEMYRERNKQ
jgi:hypothetical protein